MESSSSNALVAHGTTPNTLEPNSKQSTVIMYDGKALLDPAMALTKSVSLNTGGSGSGSNQEPNKLTMLLPTDNIRWGLNWGDSVEGTTSALIDSLRLASGAPYIPNVDGNLDDMYIELVCSISSAQLVKNVTHE